MLVGPKLQKKLEQKSAGLSKPGTENAGQSQPADGSDEGAESGSSGGSSSSEDSYNIDDVIDIRGGTDAEPTQIQ